MHGEGSTGSKSVRKGGGGVGLPPFNGLAALASGRDAGRRTTSRQDSGSLSPGICTTFHKRLPPLYH